MERSQPHELPQRLTQLFSVLGRLIVDESKAAEYDQWNREAQSVDGRRMRKERLKKLDLELERDIHQAIIESPDLQRHPESPGISLSAVKHWLPRESPITLILVGQNGCGKSCAAAYACANFPGTTHWITAADLIRVYGDYGPDAERARRRLRRCELLVIDDVATEMDPSKMCAALIEALDHRKQRRTLITTNLGPEAWAQRFQDPRLHSRLKTAEFVPDHGPDLRGR